MDECDKWRAKPQFISFEDSVAEVGKEVIKSKIATLKGSIEWEVRMVDRKLALIAVEKQELDFLQKLLQEKK